jgi:folylpolyglutamate synthase/dihydropteroate synthase
VLHRRTGIKEVPEITRKEYTAGGNTALLDALGKTINEVGAKLAGIAEENRPGKVIFFIITDGEENSSKEFSQERIKEMVELQTHTYSWEFIFMGANIDSFSTAAALGIQSDHAFNWAATGMGIRNVHLAASRVTRSHRLKECLDVEEIRKELENTNDAAVPGAGGGL